MTCEEIQDRLSAFLDDELDAVTSLSVRRHLESCASCAAEYAALERVREKVRGAEYFEAPDLLRARVLRDLDSQRARAEGPRRVRRPVWGAGALAAAATFLVLAGGTWLLPLLSTELAGNRIAREVVDGHVRSLLVDHLTDVVSTDQHTVKPWFLGKVDFAPPVTDFAAAGYPLVGGRLEYVDARQAAALVYRRRQHVINVYVWPDANAGESIAPVRTIRGYHLIRIAHGGMTYWAVSDLAADELSAFARMLAAVPAAPKA